MVSNIKQLTLNLMLLEAEMESKERIEKCKFFNKSEEFLLIAEASQEEQSFDLSQKLSEENDDYFYQFENYKMSCELDNNVIGKVSNSSSNNSFISANDKIAKRSKRLRRRNAAKKIRKNTNDSKVNSLNYESNNESSISESSKTINDDDFNMFFNAYDNHRKTESLGLSMHASSESNSQSITESSNSRKKIRLFDTLAIQTRKASSITNMKAKSFCGRSKIDSFSTAVNESINMPYATRNMLNLKLLF